MKLVVKLVVFIFVCYQVSAQDVDAFLDLSHFELPVEEEDKNIKPNIVDIKATHWDQTIYNPFKGEKLQYPFKLNFTDSSYAQPILKDMVITSRYGWRRGRAHKGIDIDLITGDAVTSILDGVVRMVSYNGGLGRSVVVRHFNGLESTYAHLSRYNVKVNDTVKRGHILGKGGNSGNSRGSHLHLILSYRGVAINPEYVLDFNDSNSIRSSELWVTKRWTSAYLHNSRRASKLELLATKEEAIASLEKQETLYVVKRGDTLSRISKRNNISIKAICNANNIRTTSVLKIGQKLVLEL